MDLDYPVSTADQSLFYPTLALLIMTSYLQNLTTMELEGCLMIGSAHT